MAHHWRGSANEQMEVMNGLAKATVEITHWA
jgi:hypothetical protein